MSWHKAEGESVSMHELVYDVSTDSLTDTDTDLRFLEIESHEEGFIAKIFVDEGTTDIKPGAPLAILVEEASDIDAFSHMTSDQLDAHSMDDPFLYQAYTKKSI